MSDAEQLPVSAEHPTLVTDLSGKYPSYFIYGPLVFSPATWQLVSSLENNSGLMRMLSLVKSPLVTRALVHVHLGAPEATARDLDRLPEDWAGQREQLDIYRRVVFTDFGFWPARTAVTTMFQEYPEAPAQPASEAPAQ